MQRATQLAIAAGSYCCCWQLLPLLLLLLLLMLMLLVLLLLLLLRTILYSSAFLSSPFMPFSCRSTGAGAGASLPFLFL
jgi:hypothetical protein